ncbi:MAG: hypothetical protein KDK78_11825, partial [Chlamydiia bacterium]|nr:hypothetical protein [Chlamydiia bacterium]
PKRGVRRATSQAITHQLEACRSDYLGLRQVIDRIDHYLTETEVFAKTYGSASSSSDLEQLDSTLGELVAGQRCLETFAAGFHTLYQKNRAAIQLWQPVTTEMDWDLLQTRLAVQAKQWGDTLLGLLRYKEDPIDYEPIDQRQWIQVNCCKQVFARDPLVQWLRQKQDNGCPLCNSTDMVRRQVLGS